MDSLNPETICEASLVDGVPAEFVPCSDRGLAYGDGLFETLALIDGKPRHWHRHLTRLQHGAQRLLIPFPEEEIWRQDLCRLQALLADHPDSQAPAVLKLILTRGSGRRGYAPEAGRASRRIAQIAPWPAGTGDTLGRVILCGTPLARSPVLAGLKHLNRLEQVLAAAEVVRAGAQEGLMFDTEGDLVAGTRGNVFLLMDGMLRTPPLEHSGVQGIMRQILLEAAPALGFPIAIQRLTRADLERCEGVILTNSLRGVQIAETLELPGGLRELAQASLLALRSSLRQRQLAP